jgi:hypothetical protein
VIHRPIGLKRRRIHLCLRERRKAIDLAAASLAVTLQEKHAESHEMFLEGVTLIPFGGRKWCYDVHYVWRSRRSHWEMLPSFHIFVLMNGIVVPSQVIKRTSAE